MDTENALTNAKESPNEIFFEEEARLWAEVYGMQSDKPVNHQKADDWHITFTPFSPLFSNAKN